jgi:hypothetical protein
LWACKSPPYIQTPGKQEEKEEEGLIQISKNTWPLIVVPLDSKSFVLWFSIENGQISTVFLTDSNFLDIMCFL